MPKAYWIVHVTVTDAEAYGEYVARDTPIIEGYGGKFIVRGPFAEAPEGAVHDRHVVIEFPDLKAAQDCYHSEAYQEVLKIRLANSEGYVVIVEGAA